MTKISKWIVFIAGIILLITLPILLVFISKWFFNIQVENWKYLGILTYTFDDIKGIYSNIVDYCLSLTSEFNIGKFYYSEAGISHFNDVRQLVKINNLLLVISSLILMLGCIKYCKFDKNFEGCLISGHTPIFWSAVIGFVIVGLIFVMCIMDFHTAFNVFHKILFPGKENWIFSLEKDSIILILPEVYFRNCGIFCGCLSILLDVSFMVIDKMLIKHRKVR